MNKSSVSPSILDSVINFRDLGGLIAANGRHVKQGMIFRSGALDQLSSKDCEALCGIPLRAIIDYRDDTELSVNPDKSLKGVKYYPVPANNSDGMQVNGNIKSIDPNVLSGLDSRKLMCDFYRKLPFSNPAYLKLVSILRSKPDGAILQHCTFGKDRTGVGSALTLFALGADEDTIMEDYLRTGESIANHCDEILSDNAKKLDKRALQQLGYLLEANPDFLRAAFMAITERYGSASSWLAHDYQLTNTECILLRDHYLA